MLRKAALATFLLAYAIYIFLPTPDQLFVFPGGSIALSFVFHISIVYALLLVSLLYYGSGSVALTCALLIGGKPIYHNLLQRYRKRRAQPLLKQLGSKKFDKSPQS